MWHVTLMKLVTDILNLTDKIPWLLVAVSYKDIVVGHSPGVDACCVLVSSGGSAKGPAIGEVVHYCAHWNIYLDIH